MVLLPKTSSSQNLLYLEYTTQRVRKQGRSQAQTHLVQFHTHQPLIYTPTEKRIGEAYAYDPFTTNPIAGLTAHSLDYCRLRRRCTDMHAHLPMGDFITDRTLYAHTCCQYPGDGRSLACRCGYVRFCLLNKYGTIFIQSYCARTGRVLAKKYLLARPCQRGYEAAWRRWNDSITGRHCLPTNEERTANSRSLDEGE